MSDEPRKESLLAEEFFGRVKAELHRFEGKHGPYNRAKLYIPYTDKDGKWRESNWYDCDMVDKTKTSDVSRLGEAQIWLDEQQRKFAVGEAA